MLDPKYVVSNLDKVRASLARRGGGNRWSPAVEQIVLRDKERRAIIQLVEGLKHKRNAASQEIAKAKRDGGDAGALLDEMKQVAVQIREFDEKAAEIDRALEALLLEMPNLPDESVPEGGGPEQNVEVRRWGKPPHFAFKPLTHDEIGEKLGIFDFKKAGEVTGARFVFLKGLGAKLERALIQFMLDTHGAAGYEEILPPFLVNRDSLTGTGQLPKFEEDVFKIEKVGYYLIPTAEVPVTNYHRNEIMPGELLPRKYCAYTPCFRSEAGSYGKDTKGLKRQHQFNKVELVKFCRPEDSAAELESLTGDAEKILQSLGLHYRVMALCGGDLGFSAQKTYDLEVWSPATGAFMEISSSSCFGEFQARRAGIRYRDSKTGKVHFVHTLNASGLAVGRTLLALIENFQKEDGTFDVPPVLAVYL